MDAGLEVDTGLDSGSECEGPGEAPLSLQTVGGDSWPLVPLPPSGTAPNLLMIEGVAVALVFGCQVQGPGGDSRLHPPRGHSE